MVNTYQQPLATANKALDDQNRLKQELNGNFTAKYEPIKGAPVVQISDSFNQAERRNVAQHTVD